MAKTLYQFNPTTFRYEEVVKTKRSRRRDLAIFLLLSFGIAAAAFPFYYRFSYSVSEVWLKNRNDILKKEYDLLADRTSYATKRLTELTRKDDYNYRIILDSSPLSSSVRLAGIGGSEKITIPPDEDFPLISKNYYRLDRLKRQVEIEKQSFQEINTMLDEKLKVWASRPAIQPVDNRQLDQLHLTYGLRPHPIFKVLRDHKGLDFSAPRGTPVYATGDGTVVKANFSGSYGNVIYIKHEQGFETRYAHLSRFKVKRGEHVRRGQVIGLVGNTGNSVSAHLHYEVLINGNHVNPINFFQRDLSNEEYEKLIRLGSQNVQALD